MGNDRKALKICKHFHGTSHILDMGTLKYKEGKSPPKDYKECRWQQGGLAGHGSLSIT